jgi:hypothetical protein
MPQRDLFRTIRTEGALLPVDLLQRVAAGDRDLPGLRAEDYHLGSSEPLNEAIVRSWNRLVGAWPSFRGEREKLDPDDPGTTPTRERWLLVLFDELHYGRLRTHRSVEIEGKEYPVSHAWENVPIHLVGCNVPLDRRTAGVAGASGQSPHGLLQELLNRSDERLWGFVSNGLQLRILRDNSSLTRQAYVEFDLEQMMESEAYSDFVVLWLIGHVSRVEAERPEDCWLERWTQEAVKQGTRALEGLRDGVEAAISALGSGFLTPGRNPELKSALRAGELSTRDYYRELLRLVYRLLFLFVAEDRGLLLHPNTSEDAQARYVRWYSTHRLRRLAEKRRGTKHGDLWESFQLVMHELGSDDGCELLGLPPLGSFLWSDLALPHLQAAQLPNASLLEAVRTLATVRDGKVLRAVDYKHLGAEELGSVYESLLELHPRLDVDVGSFALDTAAGNERKTTGSYYTPTSLISALLDSALDPVLDEAAQEGEEAILGLRVIDPACGSGHFLVAAAHRIAKRLASIRSGDEEPSPEATRHALRDVVGRCIFGVDANPMAVELCKVSLWIEAVDPGRPLSFLDAHIRCGNSLLGATPALVAAGIPDDAFKALEGDDKKVAVRLRKRNLGERAGQLTLEDDVAQLETQLHEQAVELENSSDASLEQLRAKEERYRLLLESDAYVQQRFLGDAWCAAFVQRKESGTSEITQVTLRLGADDLDRVGLEARETIAALREEYSFFHWHVEFPQVFRMPELEEKAENQETGWSGGFDCVLGNPPWETVQLTEKEFFANHPAIVGARNAAARKQLIAALEVEDPELFRAYQTALRSVEATNHLVRATGRYPLTARGKINTYAIFAELFRLLMSHSGCAGCIVPTGIATDATTQFFFRELVDARSLASLYDFENRLGLFPAVDSRMRFCLLTIRAPGVASESQFVTFAHTVEHILEPDRRYVLTPEDFALLNPNTRTLPIFRTNRDAALTKELYRRVPVLLREPDSRSPWSASFSQGLFNIASESSSFTDVASSDRVPLLEAKMIHQFTDRWATYEGAETRVPSAEELSDPSFAVTPRYWVGRGDFESKLPSEWSSNWLLGWRDICRNTDFRTVIAAALPRTATVGEIILCYPTASRPECLLANLNSFILDYVARQKLAGTHLKPYIAAQLPIIPPVVYEQSAQWRVDASLGEWIGARALELTFVSEGLRGFAEGVGSAVGPFRWDPERRELLRAELDAAFFHVYGLARDDVDYVMDTFPIARDRDVKAHGEYRTKRVILEIYDELADAVKQSVHYETRLDPPPADLRLAQPPKAKAAVEAP